MTDERLRRALEPFAVPDGPCPTAELIARLVESNLPTNEADRLRRHVAGCAACLETWRELRAILVVKQEPAFTPVAEDFSRTPAWQSMPRWTRAALAAAAVLTITALGVGLTLSTNLRRQNRELSLALAHASENGRTPAAAALVELVPDSFVLRGEAAGQVSEAPAGKPLALVLSVLEPLPLEVDASLASSTGSVLWSGRWSPPAEGVPTLFVPAGLLKPGTYSLELRQPGNPEIIQRFPFEVK